MPSLDSPMLYPAPKVQWYTPTPRKPSHENPLGIVFPEDTEKETMVTGARGVREGSPPEDLMMVKIDGALDLLPSDNFGPHFYCATAYYPGEGNAEINARKTEFAVGKANPARPDLDNCMLQKTVLVPYNRKQQLLMVEIHEVDPEDSEVEDCLIGQATLPLADRKIESSSNWPLFRGFESSGSLAVQVHIPQVNSTGPKTLDCTTPSVCKRSRRSNTPPKGFPEPVSPVSWTLPYRCKRSERSDTPPEGFPEPVSPSKVSRPTLLESLRHGKQTPEKKKCQAFDKDACTRDMGSSQIFTGCAPCDAFLESMRKGPDLLEHSPFLNSLMSGVDPVADVDIRLPTQAGGSRQQSWIGKTRQNSLQATCQQGHTKATRHPAQATSQSPYSNRLAHPTQPRFCRTGRRAACRKLQASIQHSSTNRCLAQQAQPRLQQIVHSTGRRPTCCKSQAASPSSNNNRCMAQSAQPRPKQSLRSQAMHSTCTQATCRRRQARSH